MGFTSTFNLKFIEEIKQSFGLFLPLFLSQLVYAISTFIGTIMIAHLGSEALAGLALGTITYTTLCVFFFGLFVGVGMMIAKNLGAKQHENVRNVVHSGFVLAAVYSLLFVIILKNISGIFVYLGQKESVIHIAKIYLDSIAYSIFPWLLTVVLEQFLIGLSLSRIVLIISLIQVPIEIMVNYCFVYGALGVPSYGVAGLGYGFTFTFCLSFAIVLIFIIKYHATKKYNILHHLRLRYEDLKELINTGLPVGVMNVIENLFFLVITLIIGILGIKALAAQQIVRQYVELTVTIGLAMTQATTVRVSHAVGAKDWSAIFTAIKANITVVMGIMSIIGIIYTCFTYQLIALDININDSENESIIQSLVPIFGIVAIFQLADGARLVIIGVLRSLGDHKCPLYITLATFWLISLPLGVMACFYLNLGIVGIWIWILAGMVIGLACMIMRLRYIYRRFAFN